MKILISFLLINLSLNSSAQHFDSKNTDYALLDSLLRLQVQTYREMYGLPSIQDCAVLNASARHHSYYMANTRMVSHDERMDLPRFVNLDSPRDRVSFYSSEELPAENSYVEICLGLHIRQVRTYQELAAIIFQEVLTSGNKPLIDNLEIGFMGVSTRSTKKTFFTTIKLGQVNNKSLAVTSNQVF